MLMECTVLCGTSNTKRCVYTGQEAADNPLSQARGPRGMERPSRNSWLCLTLEAGKGGADSRTAIAAKPEDLQAVFAESEEPRGEP